MIEFACSCDMKKHRAPLEGYEISSGAIKKIPEILKKAIREDGYKGFLTLEPHLVLFATLQSLEVVDATEVISENKAKDGAEGYAMQYNALCDVLKAI